MSNNELFFVDTHSHVYMSDFKKDVGLVLKRAIANGVNKILLPNVDLSTVSDMHILTEKYPENCFPMLGLHPNSVKENFKEILTLLEKNLKNKTYYSIGEIGIDLYWDRTFFEEQKIAFIQQLIWASELSLPIVIHSRKSFKEIYSILKEHKNLNLKGVFHCFSGSPTDAQKVIDLGFMIGIGGVVTFKNASMATVVEEIDLRHMLLETDAPYLAPHPHRGKRNESAYIKLIAEKIAEIKNISLKEVATQTTQNALTLFNI